MNLSSSFGVMSSNLEKVSSCLLGALVACWLLHSKGSYDIQIDSSDPDEGVWLERRTNHGYQKVLKARVMHSDPGRVEFVVEGELPPRKYAVAVYTRSGRGKAYKVVCCRREVRFLR